MISEAVAYSRDRAGRNSLRRARSRWRGILAARAVCKHADVKLSACNCYVTNGPADGQRRTASAAGRGL